MKRLTVAGPHYYTLAADSDVGGEIYERMLLQRLPQHGVDVIVGLPRDHAIAVVPGGWRVDALRHRLGLHWVAAPLVFTPWVVRALRSGDVDLLRAHSVRHAGPSILIGRALARRGRTPVVIHHHHFYPRWARLEAAILRRADAVITVSEFSRRELIAAGVKRERVHVVPDGVARPPRTHGWAEAWPAPGLRLLSLGRLEARKRPELAVQALAALIRSGVAASLVIAGDGPELPSLVERARAEHISGQVKFVGRVSEEQKWRLYDSAELLLFGSTLEGFGLVVAEAQSRGVPVIAAAGTATSEVIEPGRTGLLAAPDPEAFAERIIELADPALRREFSARAVEFAGRFDWNRCAAAVAAVYQTLVGQRSTG
jgi:glycosyltransferase involved in cell wall biosynthesis